MNEGLQLGRASLIWDVLISCAQDGRTITYKELSQKVDTHYRALGHALELIQKHCEIQKLPSLTSLVVSISTGVPGSGNKLDKSKLEKEYQLIFNYHWTEFTNPFNSEKIENTNSWWQNSIEEKFWLESTDRTDLGRNLLAPVSSNAGQKLVTFVEDGDVVFHYYQPVKSIVAFSVAKGFPRLDEIRWPDRKQSKIGPAYKIDLINFTELDQPIELKEMQDKQDLIRAIKADLDKKITGSAVYFPFQIPKEKVIRPAQGAYLSKMPKALLDLFPDAVRQLNRDIAPEISHFEQIVDQKLSIEKPQQSKVSINTSYGFQTDEKKKKATELQGMKLATLYLENLGYKVVDVSSQKRIGYDLRATKGGETVGVEVKASIMSRITVDVTSSEVEFAQLSGTDFRSLLYVVDEILCNKEGDDYKASGGRERYWWDWNPSENSLNPIDFRFTLPLN